MSMDVVLQQITKLDPVHLFKEGADAVLKDIAQFARSVDFDPATPEGRELGKSIAYKVSRSKTMIDEMGKTLVAEIKKQSGAIDAERKKVRDTLDALRDEIKKPVDEWEQVELDRKAKIEAALQSMTQLSSALALQAGVMTAGLVEGHSGQLTRLFEDTDWQEYSDHALAVYTEVKETFRQLMISCQQREAEQAELEVLRAAQRKRDEEAAEAALAEQAEITKANVAFTALYTKAHAENMAFDAAFKAVEDERKRIVAQAAADREAEIKREENKKHRALIHREISQAIVVALGHSALAADELAKSIGVCVVTAIAKGEIKHVKITY